MASRSIPLYEPDDFDWEAAVREIDSACEAASASASTSNHQPLFAPTNPYASTSSNAFAKTGNVTGTELGGTSMVKQSTLDRFVDSFTKRRKGSDGCAESKVNEVTIQRENTNRPDKSRICETTIERKNNNEDRNHVHFVQIDHEAAKTWIYPINNDVPKREYQYEISKLSLFTNTLVVLPTGLGKTLIAAVVMFNYFRWFPEGKIVFAAPSRPLVMQQIEACHKIVGIPQEWTIYMTGGMRPVKRSECWKSKRVFFLTPQVLQRDIENGICAVKNIVCLVIDEAHRAQGNFASCVVVRELLAVPVQVRILALTATPGSKIPQIQDVINNLSISILEYRDEEDPDVKPYVHNRALELIQVPLGDDANTINDLFLDVIRPHATFLGSFGLLYRRDISTISPCEILGIKAKFHEAPPSNIPINRHQEIENAFFSLITICHMRKLLSSHGIRPAYEMLEEKLKDRSFNARMSRTEIMAKIKLLMQRNLSHGAPFPKLVKMVEILTNHFKEKDPKDSRVIIFSNFRGSVKDIMDSLAKIGDLVKATEFIGQSSGRNSKGQSQKTQQAVLQKFREGGYNVIVATSIGEEGLDIMEVDLVICFDANISSLRMTQRMGRTGRKRHGRVVVLACEGSEMKGYLRKKEKTKAIQKHMRNASKSFDFRSSPRMIPHVYKPEVQFVELSIEEYIPQAQGGKKGKKVNASPFLNEISSKERDLIAKYFENSNEWKPSLIAFPSCQAFPSCVYKVHHSFRSTNMLVDSMQSLQGASFSKFDHSIKVESPSLSFDSRPISRDFTIENNVINSPSMNECTDLDAPKCDDSNLIETKCAHNFLFGGENFMTIDPNGLISILSIPTLPFNKIPSENIDINSEEENESTHNEILNSPSKEIMDLSPRLTLYIEEGLVPESPLVPKSSEKPVPEIEMSEKVLTTPLVNLVRESSSEDWFLRSATGASSSIKQIRPKFKRLRKLGEIVKKCFDENHEEEKQKRSNKSKKVKRGAFIEEEAEVSKDASGSDDDDIGSEEDEYEDSFIDDTTNPNEISTQLHNSGNKYDNNDLLAFYRRSLMTQSPHCNYNSSSSKTSTSYYSSENTPSTHERPQSSLPHQIGENSTTRQSDSRRANIINRLDNNANGIQEEFVNNKLEARKRKLSFQQGGNVDTASISVPNCTASTSAQEEKPDDDDDFYKSIDLDLLEAQATELLRQKTRLSNVETKSTNNNTNSIGLKDDFDIICDPSFDLGF